MYSAEIKMVWSHHYFAEQIDCLDFSLAWMVIRFVLPKQAHHLSEFSAFFEYWQRERQNDFRNQAAVPPIGTRFKNSNHLGPRCYIFFFSLFLSLSLTNTHTHTHTLNNEPILKCRDEDRRQALGEQLPINVIENVIDCIFLLYLPFIISPFYSPFCS